MAHQTEIVVNGQTVEVTEFDHTAQEIDDMCDAAQPILPDGPGLPVSQGGTGATTPQEALANLGAGVRPNLLINPFFQVNQRGQSSYGQGPTVDMWRLVTDGNGKATVANDGIIISGNTGTYCNFEVGIEEVPPGTYTESFLVDDHTKVSQIYANGSGQFNITENLISYTFEVKSELDSVYWGIQKFLSAGDLKIFGAKLEEGDTQTLAYQDDTGAWKLLPQPESDYATQLAKCQRYLVVIGGNDYFTVGSGIMRSATEASIVCPLPVPLRVRPVVQLSGVLSVRLSDMENDSATGILVDSSGIGAVLFKITCANPHTAGSAADSFLAPEGKLFISAEL